MDETSLKALGEQYAREADNLEKMITACKERRRFAISGGNSAEAQRQEKLMELHGQQRADLLRLSAWLRHYYRPNETDGGRGANARHQSRVA
ncbi:MAG: hypothetical protein LBB75_02720 [Oscillospiraceae bacterium]|jgi:hypothetical protein|nr:hypothetical protein [Oscillospiraceae bacterium]